VYGRRLRKLTSCAAGAATHLAHEQLPASQETRLHALSRVLLHNGRSACSQ
jgi:hypothetical protein